MLPKGLYERLRRGVDILDALKDQWFEDALCTSCGEVGLKLEQEILFD
jgi:hypothetical protein